MTLPVPEGDLQQVEVRLARVARTVLERGYEDVPQEFDDYSASLSQFEFRELVTLQLYETYCLPQRHEFELKLLTEIVEAIAGSSSARFLSEAALSGIVGSAAFELSKKLFKYVADLFHGDNERSRPFKEIEKNLGGVRAYFATHKEAHIEDVAQALHVDRDKIEPLLKLLGFRCNRRKKRSVWTRPKNW